MFDSQVSRLARVFKADPSRENAEHIVRCFVRLTNDLDERVALYEKFMLRGVCVSTYGTGVEDSSHPEGLRMHLYRLVVHCAMCAADAYERCPNWVNDHVFEFRTDGTWFEPSGPHRVITYPATYELVDDGYKWV